MESPESSSPIVTRSVAAGLRGEYCQLYPLPQWQQYALRWLGALPQGVAQFIIPRVQAINAQTPSSVKDLLIDDLAAARTRDYDAVAGQFSTVAIGAALGSVAHLALAMNAPFLPQAFVVTLKGDVPVVS